MGERGMKRFLIRLGILKPEVTRSPYIAPAPHDHKYALVHTGADCIMRCVICGEPESKAARMKREDDRIRSIITETVITDIKNAGPILEALKRCA